MTRRPTVRCCCLALLVSILTGCATEKAETAGPDYSRQLGPGESALRRIDDPARMPDLAAAFERYRRYEQFMAEALDESETWFNAPSSRQFFPFEVDGRMLTHEEAKASVVAFRDLIASAATPDDFVRRLTADFEVYESVGYNNEGVVLFTGYYAPVFDASRERTPDFDAPLYRRPADLVTDPVTGDPLGRRTATGEIVPYDTRREIDESGMFAGNELVWVRDPLSAYIIHVNGSAKLRLRDGSSMTIGYAGKTDRDYYGLGRSMVEEGHISPDNLSLPAIRNFYEKDPQTVIDLIYRNENYVFFTEYDESNWPAGSLGVQVTEETTLATDKKIYPRGGVVLVDTETIDLSYDRRRFLHFMLDQDTGGAIKAPGRADIYMGSGKMAEILAGGQYAEGRLYYFFLKPGAMADAGTGANH